jgi:hypothetical protein
MLRKLSALAAMTLVLLPIGGLPYMAHADVTGLSADLGPGSFLATAGGVPEPAAVALLCLGLAGLIVRRLAAKCRPTQAA